MTSAGRAPRGALGRADLLRLVALRPLERVALEDAEGGWFGYERGLVDAPPQGSIGAVPFPRRPSEGRSQAPPPPLRLESMLDVVHRDDRDPASHAAVEEAQVEGPTLTLSEFEKRWAGPRAPAPRTPERDLIPWARLGPALARHLTRPAPGALDLARLAEAMAAGSVPRRLPRRTRRRWAGRQTVLLDFSDRLWPFRFDMHRLAGRLVAERGESRVSIRYLQHGPLGPWRDWVRRQRSATRRHADPTPWEMPPAGSPVLLVTDLGLLAGASSAASHEWWEFVTRLRAAGVEPIALAPLGRSQLDRAWTDLLPVVRWSPDGSLHAEDLAPERVGEPEGLDDLLARAATLLTIDPPLLRELRQRLPAGGLDVGLEGAFWHHPDVESWHHASLRAEGRAVHLERLQALPARDQLAVEELRDEHHAHLRRVLDAEEVLTFSARARPEAHQARAKTIEDAESFVRDFARALREAREGETRSDWLRLAKGILERAQARRGPDLRGVMVPLARAVREVDPDASVPSWLDPLDLPPGGAEGVVEARILHDAARGELVVEAEGPGGRRAPIGAPVPIDGHGLRVTVEASGRRSSRLVEIGDLPAALAPADEVESVDLLGALVELRIEAVPRPRGAAGWARGPRGIEVTTPELAGRSATLRRADGYVPVLFELGRREGLRFGLDPFGVHATLTLECEGLEATQRLRWIEPGTFLMGSPPTEPGRWDDEGPRHEVTITRGFWLADTACTQALWEVVTGETPSHFTASPDRPVEQVSWEDVQGFLAELEARLPGCGAALPREAEWEYACRAGTTTPFSFGDRATREQVNFDGKTTVPVKSLPPNRWGLYEMHGNVEEWCADPMRDYTNEPVADPPKEPRSGGTPMPAVRGGSWLDAARRARSAYRLAWPPGRRRHDQGFRLCLRSIQPGEAEPRPGGPGQGRPEGAPPRAGMARGRRRRRDRGGEGRP